MQKDPKQTAETKCVVPQTGRTDKIYHCPHGEHIFT